MVKAKVDPRDAADDTLLRNIAGIGPSSLCTLANCGYKFTPRSTLGDFKTATGSMGDLMDTLHANKITGGYTLPKLKLLWRSGSAKRVREDEKTDGGGDKRRKMLDAGQDIDKNETSENFLLAPSGGAPNGEVEDVDNPEDTPEIDALDRHPDDTKAMPLGDVVGQVEMSVIPDVTLDVSPPDKLINGPTEVLEEAPPTILPGAALGPLVSHARFVPVVTLAEKQEMLLSAEALPSVKAAGAKDLGGDGFGSLVTEGRIGKDAPAGEGVGEASAIVGDNQIPDNRVGGSKFTSKKLGQATLPKIDENDKVEERRPNMMNASRHPFKQASLFRNHDMLVRRSALIDRAHEDRQKVMRAASQSLANRDASYYRYNAATQGVASSQMPISASNYLQSGDMFSEFQHYGANPLNPAFGPSPYVNELMIGRFQ